VRHIHCEIATIDFKQKGDISGTALTITETGRDWKTVEIIGGLKFDQIPSENLKELVVCELIGYGRDGEAYLCCSLKGGVCVLKYMTPHENGKKIKRSQENKKSYVEQQEKMVDKEVAFYKLLYSEEQKLWNVRKATFENQSVLIMPYFYQPKKPEDRIKAMLDAVEKVLKNSFLQNNYIHNDVRWRNVGFYGTEKEMKGVVFDLQDVTSLDSGSSGSDDRNDDNFKIDDDVEIDDANNDDQGQNNWVTEAIVKLRKRGGMKSAEPARQ